MHFEQITTLKRVLGLLKQISRESVYIHTKNSKNNLHFSTINKERTVLLDLMLLKEETITHSSKEKKQKFSLRTGKLFYDIMDAVENGSIVNLEFEDESLSVKVIYEDIKFKSILSSYLDGFIGFPPSNEKIVFNISGEKMFHGLNLLSKFKNDLHVRVESNELSIESLSELGSTKLIIPSKTSFEENKTLSNNSVYDYEIIKPLINASKLSNNIEMNFQWNEKIKDNVIVAKCNLKDYNGYAKYLFTPKGVLNGIS
ncbi:hypothetical protein [Methanobacterium alcaliphilum]|uniref:hypothetical protein n=1 Tax=Methanobacterium alcaliphilum TaxID=392018 RepID=UPI00200AB706|nr:hypothetical protein [Methanobacterium alcaliphilum]MCK9151813.1 hypothetical protein [Methanobacterium alcaliphilum]